MLRMVADKLFLNLMEKNRFVCESISLQSINYVANCSFFLKAFLKRKTEENLFICLT